MPGKTNEKEEIKKEKQATVTKKTASSKKTAKKEGTKSTTKVAPKSSTKSITPAKKTTKKSNTTTKKSSATTKKAGAKSTTGKKVQEKEVSKVQKLATQKSEPKKEEKVKEATVIEKIKAFIAKIVKMQEEAAYEEERKQEKESEKKETKKEIVKPDGKYMLEYYDLPYRYNETVVKILAQTPKRLFVYWDISDNDRQKYLIAFGEKFFEETYPVLLVHNEDMNYTFEVAINDFANSWYLDIRDSKSKYTIQLGRKFINKPVMVNIAASSGTESVVLQNNYVPIITSNMLEVPNDHILLESIKSKVLFRNVKNGKESYIDMNNLEFAKKIGRIYSVYDLYKEIYKKEMEEETLTSLLNPSSMSSSMSATISSSKFI